MGTGYRRRYPANVTRVARLQLSYKSFHLKPLFKGLLINSHYFYMMAYPHRGKVNPAAIPAQLDAFFDHLLAEDLEFNLGLGGLSRKIPIVLLSLFIHGIPKNLF